MNEINSVGAINYPPLLGIIFYGIIIALQCIPIITLLHHFLAKIAEARGYMYCISFSKAAVHCLILAAAMNIMALGIPLGICKILNISMDSPNGSLIWVICVFSGFVIEILFFQRVVIHFNKKWKIKDEPHEV